MTYLEKITLQDFAALIRRDESLRAEIDACPDPDSASALLCRLAEERGFALYAEAPTGKQALSEDELSAVSGGRNVLTGPNTGVIYPYSWFVTILRMLGKKDEDDERKDPSSPGSYPSDPGRS